MRGSLGIGKLFGIEIDINYSWLIIFALVTATLAVSFFPLLFPNWSILTYWVVGAVGSLLLFVSVVIHELAHSLVAKSQGIPVRSITLFIFGGVSSIQQEPQNPTSELLMAAVGPATSLLLGILFLLALAFFGGVNEQLAGLLIYLGAVNILLAAFNMIPGFPLDGGRVFRAIVWYITHNLARATRIAAAVGRGVAYLFIFVGLLLLFTGDFLSGIWLMLIGWFLNNAAEASAGQVATLEALRGIKVGQLMTPSPPTVSPGLSLRRLVDEFILQYNLRAVPVVENGELVGLITLGDITHVPQERWDTVTVGEVMRKAEQLKTIRPEDSVGTALQALAEEDLNQVPVVKEHRVVGLLTRSNIIRFLGIRQQLGRRT